MTKEFEKAKAEHDKFLKRMNCVPKDVKSRVKERKNKSKFKLSFEGTAATYFEKKELSDVLQGDMQTATKRDVITNIYKELPAVQAEIKAKAACIGIAYNKGGYQYITPESDLKTLGKK